MGVSWVSPCHLPLMITSEWCGYIQCIIYSDISDFKPKTVGYRTSNLYYVSFLLESWTLIFVVVPFVSNWKMICCARFKYDGLEASLHSQALRTTPTLAPRMQYQQRWTLSNSAIRPSTMNLSHNCQGTLRESFHCIYIRDSEDGRRWRVEHTRGEPTAPHAGSRKLEWLTSS